jgi:hypothetical protein
MARWRIQIGFGAVQAGYQRFAFLFTPINPKGGRYDEGIQG